MEDVERARRRRCDREVGKAFSPRAGTGEARAPRTVWLVIACVALLSLASLCGVYRPPVAIVAGAFPGTSRRQQREQQQGDDAPDAVFSQPSDVPMEIAAEHDERSCLSRYQSAIYRKPSPHKPSPYLLHRLRKYEELHRRCSPHTAAYNRTLQSFTAGSPAPDKETDCKYVLWTPLGGLGNRILTLASTFLYALLTDRVLLIDPAKDMAGLFCEPFPESTWLLPPGVPIADFAAYDRAHAQSYGNLWKNNKINSKFPPSFVYVHLGDDYQTEDMHFFCEPDQAALRRVPWLLLRSDLYFVPALFLNQDFEPELGRLFPEKETVFHHLSRYLFHPTNDVWGMITRYYRAYLATARERLGIQIRVFSSDDAPFELVAEQIINCTLKEKLLPEIDAKANRAVAVAADADNTKAVLLTSLHSGYLDRIKDMYWENAASGGAAVGVHQPTHEEEQQTGKLTHDAKAWAEMNLLSLSDALVTSAWSTFGYTAQGLAGIRPWVLLRPVKAVRPEPTCVREVSMEPCYHRPTWYVCREKKEGDNGKVVPFVTHCMDATSGIKLVDRT